MKSIKQEPDAAQTAFAVLQHVIDVTEGREPKTTEPEREKNPAAVALGRLGGLKGGNARAEKLSPERRKEIAKIAATSRWKNHRMQD